MSNFARTRTPIVWRRKDQISFAFCSLILLACMSYVLCDYRWWWQNDRRQTRLTPQAAHLLYGGQQGNLDQKPTSDYGKLTIQGFTVFVDRKILSHPAPTQQLKQQLNRILAKLRQITTPTQFATLKQTKIWLSSESLYTFEQSGSLDPEGRQPIFKTTAAGGYYTSASADQLKALKLNPDKARSIEIGDATRFLKYRETVQMALILHELAHAHHHQVLGYKYQPLRSAYQEAMAGKLYTMISLRTKRDGQVYAATNAHEYFAELSVAYLATNDGFPRDREILEEYDPIGYELMVAVWGKRDAQGRPIGLIEPDSKNTSGGKARR